MIFFKLHGPELDDLRTKLAAAEAKLSYQRATHADLEKVVAENARLRDALNRIGLLGHSEHAYTREFTERALSIVASALKGEK